MQKIAIIGADSFIAGKFISSLKQNNQYSKILFARKTIDGEHYILKKDFFDIGIDELYNVDIVINFAAIVHKPKNTSDELYYKINTQLPDYIGKISKKAGVKKFIHMSSIAVYETKSKINENTYENPRTIYGKSKLLGDRKLLKLKTEKFSVSIVRPPMVYGGGLSPGNMQKMIKLALSGIPTPFKGINNKRDFIHVENLILLISILLKNKIDGIIIPTDRHAVSTSDIISVIKIKSEQRVNYFHPPKLILYLLKLIKPSLYNKLYGDLRVESNINSQLYKPKKLFDKGIEEILESLKSHNDN